MLTHLEGATYRKEENEKIYTHCFTDLNQILEYCKKSNIQDKFIMDGLKNSIANDYHITKYQPSYGSFCMG